MPYQTDAKGFAVHASPDANHAAAWNANVTKIEAALDNGEADTIKLVPRATAPATPAEGLMYYNSTDHHYYIYNGTAWVELG